MSVYTLAASTLKKSSQDELVDLVYKNSTFGVWNRKAFELYQSDNQNDHSLMMVDVDNLKYVNDNISHEAGDALIWNVGQILLGFFPYDHVYHLSGDEFVVILDHTVCLYKSFMSYHKHAQHPMFSFGEGNTLSEADRNLMISKQDRLNTGKRDKRGVEPQNWSTLRLVLEDRLLSFNHKGIVND